MSGTSTRSGRHSAAPPVSVEEALADAVGHARTAAAEALLAMRALLDAACIAIHGEPAALPKQRAHEGSATRLAFAGLANGFDELSRRVGTGEVNPPAELVHSLLDALDTEIGRWEQRSSDDQEARAVLRAFLGLREILWEFGMRRADADPRAGNSDAQRPTSDEAPDRTPAPRRKGPRARRRGRPRVQRVEVQG